MSASSPRFPAIVLGMLLVASAPLASAQVTLHLNTAQQTSCVATTDASGLSLVPGGTDLQASGVTLTGAGCGGGDFQAALSVASTSVVSGNPVNVTWSTAQAATQCTYGGSAGLTGWPLGASACQGAACAGPHVVPVTPTAAGSYNLSITCTNDTGFKQAALTATAPATAPQPANFALTAPATATINTAFQVSWSVTGAASCTGSAQLNGSSTSLTGWTDTTSPTSPRTVTATQAGTYTLDLSCANTVGATPSQSATVVVGGGTGGSCPVAGLTRLTTASIRYPNIPNGAPGAGTRSNVDLTVFDNIWGHANTIDTALPWPGRNSAVPAIIGWAKTQFVAARFTATTSTTPIETLSYSTYNSGPDLTLAVSSTCGDFAPTNPNCLSEGVGTGEGFKKIVLAPYINGCPLTPGNEYYINIKMTNPLPADCNSCTLATTNIVSTQP